MWYLPCLFSDLVSVVLFSKLALYYVKNAAFEAPSWLCCSVLFGCCFLSFKYQFSIFLFLLYEGLSETAFLPFYSRCKGCVYPTLSIPHLWECTGWWWWWLLLYDGFIVLVILFIFLLFGKHLVILVMHVFGGFACLSLHTKSST